MPTSSPPVLLVSPNLDGLPGQARYVHELRRHLPGPARHLELAKPAWAQGAASRTVATWMACTSVKAPDGHVLHGTDTFCAVPGVDVITIHDLIPLLVSKEWTARLHWQAFARRLRRAQVITLTHTWADRIARALRIPVDSVHVVPQGCSVAPPAQRIPPPPAFAPGRRHVLVSGAYRPYKQVHRLLGAAAGLRDVRIVRIGPPARGRYARMCLDIARRTGCDLMDVGPVPEADLGAYYAAADLVFYASREEGFGFPPLEAMACGTPSLVSDIPVFRELYGDHVLYAGQDLRADLLAALEAPREPARLRAHAARFTWERTARGTAAVHRLAADLRGAARAASDRSKAGRAARPGHAVEHPQA